MSPLLEVDDLSLEITGGRVTRRILDGVTFGVSAGEAVGLVGESGSGKSMTLRSVVRLLPNGARLGGGLRFDGQDVLTLGRRQLRDLRGQQIATIFQDPRAAVNPMRRIGDFLLEAPVRAAGRSVDQVRREAIELLGDVGIERPERCLEQYPHELSGGMLQRVVIAGALLLRPRLLLADEPTTALDVTTQAEVVAILDQLRRDRGLALVFVTHDLDLAAAICDRTVVMYAGGVVEDQASARLHDFPLHPYTAALAAARPSMDHDEELSAIPGRPASAFEFPSGCAFAPRCPFAERRCSQQRPVDVVIGEGRARCLRAEELSGEAAL